MTASDHTMRAAATDADRVARYCAALGWQYEVRRSGNGWRRLFVRESAGEPSGEWRDLLGRGELHEAALYSAAAEALRRKCLARVGVQHRESLRLRAAERDLVAAVAHVGEKRRQFDDALTAEQRARDAVSEALASLAEARATMTVQDCACFDALMEER